MKKGKRIVKYATISYCVFRDFWFGRKKVWMLEKGKREGDPNSRSYTLPGGKLESWEKGLNNPEGRLAASLREMENETGMIPKNPVLRGVILFDNSERTFPDWPNLDDFLVYIYTSTKYKLGKKKEDEGKPWKIYLDKINDVPTKNPGDKEMYKWLKDGRNFYGVIKHKGDNLDEEGTWVDFF